MIKHVVAITDYHESASSKKVTVVNTNPNGANQSIVKKVPEEWLDRNIHPNDGIFEDRAVIFLGIPLVISRAEDVYQPELIEAQNRLQKEVDPRDRLLQRRKQHDDCVSDRTANQWRDMGFSSKRAYRNAKKIKNP